MQEGPSNGDDSGMSSVTRQAPPLMVKPMTPGAALRTHGARAPASYSRPWQTSLADGGHRPTDPKCCLRFLGVRSETYSHPWPESCPVTGAGHPL